jgi:hypothetical protein
MRNLEVNKDKNGVQIEDLHSIDISDFRNE